MRFVPRGLSTVGFRAMALVVGLIGTLVVVLATYFPARHLEAVRAAMEEKAVTYAHLVAQQVESGVAFDDRGFVDVHCAEATRHARPEPAEPCR